MLKIKMILTGGTIGSYCSQDVIDVNTASPYLLLDAYEKKYGKEIDFSVETPFQSLSENMTPHLWEQLYGTVNRIDFAQYDGVIIAHGTDTLSYTSAFIGMLFAHTPVPIIFIAANYPIEDPRSNGIVNLHSAVEMIKEKKVRGVFTVFQDCHQKNQVYLATRLLESDTHQDQYTSYGGEDFAEIKKGKLIENVHFKNPSLAQLNRIKPAFLKEDISFSNSILFLKAYPGLDYSYINLDKKPKAILHYLYHSATGCTYENYSLIDFIETCKEKGIAVYVASFKDKEQTLYATGKKILESGAIPLYNISPEAAYVKLLIAYNQTEKTPEEVMENTLFFETVPQKFS